MDTVALVGRLLISLAFVLCLMWFLARRYKNGTGRVKGARLIDVLGRQQVARNSSVAVIRVLDKALIVGVTDGQVSVLAETELAAVEAQLASTDKPGARLRRAAGAAPAIQSPATPAIQSPAAPAGAVPAVPAAQSSARAAADRALAGIRAKSAVPVPAGPVQAAPRGALAGSALSPQTWRQTLDALRDLTVRNR